ncbi:MAG: translation initiation factor IF-3 [Clostridiales bacterium]|nr:translation initiation factor IF-3 [Clostridiales bacterium]
MINDQIYDKEVRLIASDGSQLGIMSKAEAQKIADAANLDLVKVAPNARPAVCKIMDYGKYRFDEIKKGKELKKAQKIIEVKEIRLSQTIDVGDINTKSRRAREFLNEGNKVKVNLRMYGRQQAHPEVSMEVLNRFAEILADISTIDKRPTTEGRNMFLILSPIKK